MELCIYPLYYYCNSIAALCKEGCAYSAAWQFRTSAPVETLRVLLASAAGPVALDRLLSARKILFVSDTYFLCALACGCRAIEFSPCLLRDHSAEEEKKHPGRSTMKGGCMRSRPPLALQTFEFEEQKGMQSQIAARISGHVSRGVLVVLFSDGGEMCCTQPPVTYKKTSAREPYFPSSNDRDIEKNGTREDEGKNTNFRSSNFFGTPLPVLTNSNLSISTKTPLLLYTLLCNPSM